MGVWYEIFRFPVLFEKGKCQKATYRLKENGHIEVSNREIVKGKESLAKGDAYRPDDSAQGKLLVKFSDFQPYGDYWVVNTDYDTYTVVYSCGGIAGLLHLEYAWILARNRTLDASVLSNLMEELSGYKVDVGKFIQTDQSDCPS